MRLASLFWTDAQVHWDLSTQPTTPHRSAYDDAVQRWASMAPRAEKTMRQAFPHHVGPRRFFDCRLTVPPNFQIYWKQNGDEQIKLF
jgi:hypothetical protein